MGSLVCQEHTAVLLASFVAQGMHCCIITMLLLSWQSRKIMQLFCLFVCLFVCVRIKLCTHC